MRITQVEVNKDDYTKCSTALIQQLNKIELVKVPKIVLMNVFVVIKQLHAK